MKINNGYCEQPSLEVLKKNLKNKKNTAVAGPPVLQVCCWCCRLRDTVGRSPTQSLPSTSGQRYSRPAFGGAPRRRFGDVLVDIQHITYIIILCDMRRTRSSAHRHRESRPRHALIKPSRRRYGL